MDELPVDNKFIDVELIAIIFGLWTFNRTIIHNNIPIATVSVFQKTGGRG